MLPAVSISLAANTKGCADMQYVYYTVAVRCDNLLGNASPVGPGRLCQHDY